MATLLIIHLFNSPFVLVIIIYLSQIKTVNLLQGKKTSIIYKYRIQHTEKTNFDAVSFRRTGSVYHTYYKKKEKNRKATFLKQIFYSQSFPIPFHSYLGNKFEDPPSISSLQKQLTGGVL